MTTKAKMDTTKTKLKISWFKTAKTGEKEKIKEKQNAANTNKSTRLWVKCLTDYLEEKEMPKIGDIPDDDLPKLLSNFYLEICKTNRKFSDIELNENDLEEKCTEKQDKEDENDLVLKYKNQTLCTMRAALNRYFKNKQSIDIISSPKFIQANSVFQEVLAVNKEQDLVLLNPKTQSMRMTWKSYESTLKSAWCPSQMYITCSRWYSST